MSRISVIIPCYNSTAYLPQAIESVLAQTYQNYEIILVDDGSTDRICEVVSSYLPSLHYIRQENRGPASARNTGLRAAKGEYLVFLDADDELLPGKLELQVNFLEQNPAIDIVYANGYTIKVVDGSEERELFSENGLLDKSLGSPEQSLKSLALSNAFPIHTAMVRAQCVLEIGGFDEDLVALEDWDLWFRLAQEHHFAYLDEIVARYRVIPSGLTHNSPRQALAFDQVHSKIERSQAFFTLSPEVRAEFYYTWGMMTLEAGRPAEAVSRLKKSIECRSRDPHPRFAYMLALLLGRKAIYPYLLKRKLFGVRGERWRKSPF